MAKENVIVKIKERDKASGKKERHSWLYYLSAILFVVSIVVVIICCIIAIWIQSPIIKYTGAVVALMIPISYATWKMVNAAEKQIRAKAKIEAYDKLKYDKLKRYLKDAEIGNWFEHKDWGEVVIASFPRHGVARVILNKATEGYYYATAVKPISLTKRWLVDFGFKKGEKEASGKYFLGNFWLYVDNSIRHDQQILEYVHDLQNIYLDKVGKKLTKTSKWISQY